VLPGNARCGPAGFDPGHQACCRETAISFPVFTHPTCSEPELLFFSDDLQRARAFVGTAQSESGRL
jgi:hypothetical protein